VLLLRYMAAPARDAKARPSSKNAAASTATLVLGRDATAVAARVMAGAPRGRSGRVGEVCTRGSLGK
jgi:hypothetical protein